ncbi:MAG: T9SS type A sorting domain-containing protein [Paludibacteraceae bacterium]|nr:T9SS type A sorting domain-containing protein [Paludibacteraceae bacterium]
MKHQVASSGTKGHDQNDVGNCCSNLTFDIVNNIFRIYTLEQVFSIRLYSLSGQPVLQTTKTEIDVSSLPSGMYIVRAITVDGEQLQAKFIKQ